MAQPTIVYAWSSQAAATTTTPTPAVSVGDLAIVWKVGSPTSVGTGTPTGFTSAASGTSNNGTSTKASIFYKVLASGDISGGNLISVDLSVGGTTTLRIGLMVVRHANGWDSSTTLVASGIFNTNTAAPATVATMTDVTNSAIGFVVWDGVGNNAQQFTWAGSGDGTSARDPYFDESSTTTYTIGGHGVGRTDSTGVSVNGTTTVSNSNAVALDLGSGITNTNIPAGAYITAVNVGVGYTISASATGSNSNSQTLIKPHYGTNTNTIQADYALFDGSDTPGTITAAVGTAANTYVVGWAEFKAKAAATTSNVTDTAAATDAITQTQKIHYAASDSAPATDVANWNQGGHLTVGDTAAATDTTSKAKLSLVTETAGATEVLSRVSRVTATDTAHATDSTVGYNTSLLDFQLGNPGAGPFLVVDLNAYAKKVNSGDTGDIRLTLYEDVGDAPYGAGYGAGYGTAGVQLAQSGWQTLTTSFSLFTLAVPVSSFSDPANLTAVIEVRSPTTGILAAEVSQVYLEASTGFTPAESAAAVDTISQTNKLHLVATDTAHAIDTTGSQHLFSPTDSAPAVDAVSIIRVLGKRANIYTSDAANIYTNTAARVA